MFRPPANFKVAARSQQGNRTTTEYTPVAESAENWSEMLTLIAINGLRDTKPETMVDQIAKQWYGVCANMANVLPRVGSEGAYPFRSEEHTSELQSH